MKRKVSGNSFLFFLFRAHVMLFIRLFYRQFRIEGIEKIPKGVPVIFAPNHQNAFMDALVLLHTTSYTRQLSYLVRASIFKSAFARFILFRINMLPVYRKDVDGKETMDKNDEIFENCIWLMEKGRILVLFPEGTHNPRRYLIPLKKGFSRIAFNAEERNNFNLDIHIVPIGINYSEQSVFFRDLLVRIGDPVRVKEYEEVFKENANKANALVKSEIESRLRPLMIDIREHAHYYTMIEHLREMERNERGLDDFSKYFDHSKVFIERIEKSVQENPEKADQMRDLTVNYFRNLHRYGFRDKIFSSSWRKVSFLGDGLIAVLLLPVFLFGFIHSYLPFMIPKWVAGKFIKDKGFVSSILSALSMFTFPVFYNLYELIFFLITWNIWWTFLYAVAIPLSAPVAFWCLRKYKKMWHQYRFNSFRKTKAYETLSKERQELCSYLDQVM